MNPELPLPCPNPECKAPCELQSKERAYWVTCNQCFYNGPSVENADEALRLHNLLCRLFPAADEGANRGSLIAELEGLAQSWLDEANEITGNPLELALGCQKRLDADAIKNFINGRSGGSPALIQSSEDAAVDICHELNVDDDEFNIQRIAAIIRQHSAVSPPESLLREELAALHAEMVKYGVIGFAASLQSILGRSAVSPKAGADGMRIKFAIEWLEEFMRVHTKQAFIVEPVYSILTGKDSPAVSVGEQEKERE